jgi:hypothetical protein
MVSLRRAGGSLRAPPFQDRATGASSSVAVAVGPRGDVLVAWERPGDHPARYRASERTGFQPIEDDLL